jgi:hypothetical protein
VTSSFASLLNAQVIHSAQHADSTYTNAPTRQAHAHGGFTHAPSEFPREHTRSASTSTRSVQVINQCQCFTRTVRVQCFPQLSFASQTPPARSRPVPPASARRAGLGWRTDGPIFKAGRGDFEGRPSASTLARVSVGIHAGGCTCRRRPRPNPRSRGPPESRLGVLLPPAVPWRKGFMQGELAAARNRPQAARSCRRRAQSR